jgi:GntR family transcriptional regulator
MGMNQEPPPSRYQWVADALRKGISSGRYQPGDKLPSEGGLAKEFKVSRVTARLAIAQLRGEGLIHSRVGSGVVVAPPRRLSNDILRGFAFYRALERQGLQAAVTTSITRAPASEEVAEALKVEVGAQVLVHERLTRAEGGKPIFLATNFFPLFVVEAAPQLESESTSGLTRWVGQAFGELYGEDVLDARMPTPEEQERLEIPPDTPVVVIRGINRDSQHRALHYVTKVSVAGRMEYGYRFGVVPS